MSTLGSVEIQIEDRTIERVLDKKLDEKIDEKLVPSLRMVTEKRLCSMYSMSPNELAPLLAQPQVKIHERRKGERGKKRWFYPEVQYALDEVINEQY